MCRRVRRSTENIGSRDAVDPDGGLLLLVTGVHWRQFVVVAVAMPIWGVDSSQLVEVWVVQAVGQPHHWLCCRCEKERMGLCFIRWCWPHLQLMVMILVQGWVGADMTDEFGLHLPWLYLNQFLPRYQSALHCPLHQLHIIIVIASDTDFELGDQLLWFGVGLLKSFSSGT